MPLIRFLWAVPVRGCDIPPLSKDDQSYPESLRGAIIEVMMHNTSHPTLKEGWLSRLKWLPSLKLSKVELFTVLDVVLLNYSLPGQHLQQVVLFGLHLCNSYIRGCPHHSHPLKLNPTTDTKRYTSGLGGVGGDPTN
jgi:hypothetical protein